jgi:hypothetical protein
MRLKEDPQLYAPLILKGLPQKMDKVIKDTVAMRKGGLVKGSKQAKAYMAKIRAMKKK